MDIGDLAGFAGLVASIAAVITAWNARRRLQAENKASEGSASESFERAAQSAAERALKLDSRVGQLEEEVTELHDKLMERDRLIAEQAAIIADLQDWAERLAHQVRSLGGIPVEIRRQDGKAE